MSTEEIEARTAALSAYLMAAAKAWLSVNVPKGTATARDVAIIASSAFEANSQAVVSATARAGEQGKLQPCPS